ncbi:MAG: hypothetical protein OHK0024_07020 [Thalassobaculales bacterium]
MRAAENRILRGIRMLGRHFLVYAVMPLVHATSARVYVQHIPDFMFPLREYFRSFQKDWEHGRKGNNRGDYARLLFFVVNLKQVLRNQVPGQVAELGVFKGNTAKVIRRLLPDRKLFLFDTFEGFAEADTRADPSGANRGHYACGLDAVQRYLGVDDKIIYCVGRFPETTHHVGEDERFAVVHLDCDLYTPTRAALEYFYPRMSPGGLIIIHDYFGDSWPGVTEAVDEFLRDKPEGVVIIPDKSGTAVITVAARDRANAAGAAGGFGFFLYEPAQWLVFV